MDVKEMMAKYGVEIPKTKTKKKRATSSSKLFHKQVKLGKSGSVRSTGYQPLKIHIPMEIVNMYNLEYGQEIKIYMLDNKVRFELNKKEDGK